MGKYITVHVVHLSVSLQECMKSKHKCDGHKDCSDGSDEYTSICHNNSSNELQLPPVLSTLSPPVLIHTNQNGRLTIKLLTRHDVKDDVINADVTVQGREGLPCPAETHFKCSRYCMPVYLRCNGIKDCPNGEDESSCDR